MREAELESLSVEDGGKEGGVSKKIGVKCKQSEGYARLSSGGEMEVK